MVSPRERLRDAARNLTRAVTDESYRRVARRDYAFRLLRRLTPLAAVDGSDARYLVSTADYAVGRETYMRRGYDGHVIKRLLDLASAGLGRPVLEGKVFVDIGANIGTTTIPAIRRFGAATAVAFEPAPDTYELLVCNIVLNGLSDRVRAVHVALSDEPGTVTLELSASNWGDRRVRPTRGPGGADLLGESDWTTVDVRSATFDAVADELDLDLDQVGLVWIDTQGHEANVLAGARCVLERKLPLVVEYWPYGLRRARGIDRLHELLASAYPRFVDGRADDPRPRPTAELPMLATRYPGPDDYTDLLLLGT